MTLPKYVLAKGISHGLRGARRAALPRAASLLLLLAAPLLLALSASAQPATKRILIISGSDPNHPGFTVITQRIRSIVRDGSKDRVEILYEIQGSLLQPPANPSEDEELTAYLKRKYSDKKIDLIFVGAAPRLRGMLKSHPDLFAGVPKVFYDFEEEREPTYRDLGPDITGVWARTDYSQTLDLALSQHPNAKRVVVVAGKSAESMSMLEKARAEFRKYEGRVEFVYLTDLTIAELKERLATLPPDSIVYYLIFYIDRAGNRYPGAEALSMVAPTSAAPIYGNSGSYLGNGIVGGSLIDFETIGQRLGEVCLRVLNGERAGEITSWTAPNVTTFDWRELKRWGIGEDRLPPGSVVKFREFSFWELYKWYIVGIAAALVAESLLIAYLLLVQRRRRLAERERERLTAQVEAEHRHLNETVSNVPGIVWETRLDPETDTRKTTFISDYVEKMLGYTSEEWLAAPPGLGLRLTPKEDREAAARASEEVMKSGREVVYQHRWRAKDGRTVWAESHLSPMLDGDGKVVGLRGVSIDITEKRLAEDARRRSEERNLATLRAIPDLMFLQTRDGVYLEYYARDVKELFVPPEQFVGKNMRDVMPPELAEMFLERFRLVDDSGDPQVIEYDLNIDGWQRWYEARMVRSGEDILSVVRDITERKRAEAELSFQARMLNTVEQAAIATDMSGVVFYWNRFAERLYGWSAEEVMGRPVKDFLSYEHARELADEIWAQLRAGRGWAGEFTMRRRDRAVLQIWVNDSLIYNDAGVPVGVLGISHDITERKRAEEALRESEERFAKAFQSNPQPMSLTTLDGGLYVDVNESFLDMSGYARAEVIGRTSLELNIWETPAARADFVRRLGEQGAVRNLETLFRTRGGAFRVLLSSAERMEIGGRTCLLVASSDITERKAADEALRESEEKYRTLFESIDEGFCVFELLRDGDGHAVDGLFSVANPAFERQTGLKDAPGRRIGELIPDLEDFWFENYGRIAATGKPERFTGQVAALNRWFDIYAFRVGDEGSLTVAVIFSDVTERIRAEEKIRRSEAVLKQAGRMANLGAWEVDLTHADEINDNPLAWSDQVYRIYGYEPGAVEVTSGLFFRHVHPDDRGRIDREIHAAVNERKPYEQEHRIVRADGAERVVQEYAVVDLDEAGRPLRIFGAVQDITERKEAEEALRQSESRFRNMADTAPVMIWMATPDKLCNYFNKQWLDFTGRSMEEELGEGWTEGLHPEDHARCLEVFNSSFDRREPFKMEYRVRRADGAYRWVFDIGTPRISSAGEFLGFIGSCVDIHDRKESEEALRRVMEEVNRLKNQLQQENIYLREEIKLEHNFSEIVGRSDAIKYVLHKIEQVAPTAATVLITGETGTGKELVARAIHGESPRHDRPLVKVNCAALAPGLVESELFGHERGAFTGAVGRKIGRFELADGATIFLDEIGELPLELQVKLLRVIQEGEFERLGGNRTLRVDVRIIAATNRDLWKEVQAGAFREDLFYRLNVFPVTMPPLRQRAEDIPLLVEHFVAGFAKKMGKKITSVTPTTLQALRSYPWPGNVRELANVIERAVINNVGPVLQISNLAEAARVETPAALNKTLEEIEREYIITVLDGTGWRIEGLHGAARILGLHPSTLRTRMAKLGVQKPHVSPT